MAVMHCELGLRFPDQDLERLRVIDEVEPRFGLASVVHMRVSIEGGELRSMSVIIGCLILHICPVAFVSDHSAAGR